MKYSFTLILITGSLLALPLSSALADGKATYEKTCKMCHATGMAGAPKVGDKADWAARSKQGLDTLVQHAIKGFKGSKGMMPPKGGNPGLSDADVKAAIQYMLDQSK
ncbi:MAG TPA: cytochrome c5 family protein [Gammaproteobacteria bacterium]|nr:cytochrome c5 family protein [Gammaproteobacteria bacterium]